uniref:Plastocyanin-like domain-containing protein n=1 Tax=Arcella intermedia TaxID=1963864 RepID=A0A6B2LV44_9EUKA
MHGHTFWVLGMGNTDEGPYQGQALETITPIERDTASVNPNSWLYIRVRMTNPGAWAFHSHIEWHLSNGLYIIFVSAPEMVRARLGTLPTLPSCPL